MFLRFAIISLLFCSLIKADDEIRVQLATRSHLSSIYLSQVFAESSLIATDYLQEMRKILEFDLSHSGYAQVSPTSPSLEKDLDRKDLSVAFNPQKWARRGSALVLKIEVTGKSLDLYALDLIVGKLKKFEKIPITGKREIDRKQMHKLSDAIIKMAFGIQGVADTRILYSLQEQGPGKEPIAWKSEIWECDWDGGNPKQVTFENGYAITPTFFGRDQLYQEETYRGDRFLYVNYKNGQPKIYFSSTKTGIGKPLIGLRGNQLLPSVSKQRDKMVFVSDASGRADLFLQQLDAQGDLVGKPKQIFSYPRSTQASSTFSPDGLYIAFVSDKDGTPRIYVIPSNTESNKRPQAQLLTRKNRENTSPSWSPDGKKLAYSAKTNGVRQIWIYDFISKEERQLTTGSGNKENPQWGPNSLHIVFNSTDPGFSELFIVNLNQPEAIQITSGSGKKHYPTWGIR